MEEEPPVLHKAPPLDPAWLRHEQEAGLLAPKPAIDPIVRQQVYAAQCRERNNAMIAPGARDHHLAHGIQTKTTHVPSTLDGYAIPMLQYDRTTGDKPECSWVVIYYHGGGLLVGEGDSEDLSSRRIVKDSEPFLHGLRLYSVGYRLRPQHPATTIVQDCVDAFDFVKGNHPRARVIVVGSSSGGQLAALVTQRASKASFQGVVLRCPVTSDAFSGRQYVPEELRDLHTSAWDRSFDTSLLGVMQRDVPRDGLDRMPLEAEEESLKGMPRTWIQVCTNDVLYSDGACYGRALRNAGVEVRTDVVWGWPHTFWLKAPHLQMAWEADKAMLEGLAWIAGMIN
ncbi:Alpha/Beta hydrolase protein [Diaporthe sp. PMI_573]|nr:Alpha/Beta hydrolase protein [Diaporthaceae sp. PMI_573]